MTLTDSPEKNNWSHDNLEVPMTVSKMSMKSYNEPEPLSNQRNAGNFPAFLMPLINVGGEPIHISHGKGKARKVNTTHSALIKFDRAIRAVNLSMAN